MQRELKRKRQRMLTFFIIFALVIVAVLVALRVVLNRVTPDEIGTTQHAVESTNRNADDLYNAYIGASAVLKSHLDEDPALETNVRRELGDGYNTSIVVFISVSDGESPALVVSGSGATLELAWQNADAAAGQLIRDKLYTTKYVRADIVNSIRRIASSALSAEISDSAGIYGEFFRKGIAFDPTFHTALLESEINANELIDYDVSKDLVLDKVNLYLTKKGADTLASIPENVYLFTARAYSKDSEGCHDLVFSENTSYGRREVSVIDRSYVESLSAATAQYLLNGIGADGKFAYGNYPLIGLSIDKYDLAYHGMALSAVAKYSAALDTAGLYADNVQRAADYLLQRGVKQNDATAFVYDDAADEINAGAVAQAILALCDYSQIQTQRTYLDFAATLGNGLISMIDTSAGRLNHALYYDAAGRQANFTVKDANLDSSYDCMAVYALAKLYGETGNAAYLSGAKTLAELLVRGDYAQNGGDPWLSEALDELTKYDKSTQYFDLALRNYTENADALENRVISDPQYTRLLTATYNVYKRMQSEQVATDVFKALDYTRMITACVNRANDLLNGFAYPEVAMYFNRPDDCVGAFYVRQDGFRIRIDDMASFIDAYLAYGQDYTAVNADVFEAQERAAALATTVPANG